jgi:hypothetical protein
VEFMASTCIDYLVDEGSREIVFGISLVYVMEINTNVDGTLNFIHMDRIRNP